MQTCVRCNDRACVDEWTCYCYECEQEMDRIEQQAEDNRLRIEREDDGPCTCQSCRGYPDGFIG